LGNSVAYASDLPDFWELLRITAAAKELPPTFVEKDYFAMRALRQLSSELNGQFVFKGGTSLSKGWAIINRFSEDLDLLFHCHDGNTRVSNRELSRRLERARDLVESDSVFSRILSEERPGSKSRTSFFAYDSVTERHLVIRPRIQLDSGCRGEPQPLERRTIASFVTEHVSRLGLGQLADDLSPFEVDCLHFTRTFVEKLFAIHDLFLSRKIQGRMRHYYDVYSLIGVAEIPEFLKTSAYADYCSEIREYIRREFPEACIPSEQCFKSSPALNPSAPEMRELESYYEDEMELFFGVVPSFRQIIERIFEVRDSL
jgi:hypothetical protein